MERSHGVGLLVDGKTFIVRREEESRVEELCVLYLLAVGKSGSGFPEVGEGRGHDLESVEPVISCRSRCA
jgi:hypothetical protein